MKKLTPFKALRLLEAAAKRAGLSPCAYCESRGVSKGIVSKWKKRPDGTVLMSTLERLGIK